MIDAFFMIDSNVNIITREVYTIADALASTGGFIGLIDIIVLVLIGWLQERYFF